MDIRLRRFLLKLRFAVPAFIFVMTMFLVYLCVMDGFVGLFECRCYVTVSLLWGLFSLFLILWFGAFFILMFSDAGSMENEIKHFHKHGCKLRCIKCGVVKPMRTHHCSKCDKCFARMDHHCDALGICIGLRNGKVFIAFLVYSIAMLLIYSGSCFSMIFVNEWDSFPHILVMDTFVGASLAILVAVLAIEQMLHLLAGQTALEIQFGIVVETDRDWRQRLHEVFGPLSVKWLLPTPLDFADVSPFMWEKYRQPASVCF